MELAQVLFVCDLFGSACESVMLLLLPPFSLSLSLSFAYLDFDLHA